jgi:hypothetical protein
MLDTISRHGVQSFNGNTVQKVAEQRELPGVCQ